MAYELIEVHHGDRWSKNDRSIIDGFPVRITAFKKDYTLNLTENNDFLIGSKTPIYLASSTINLGKVTYRQKQIVSIFSKMFCRKMYSFFEKHFIIHVRMFLQPFLTDFELYHDLDNEAALIVYRDNRNRVNFVSKYVL